MDIEYAVKMTAAAAYDLDAIFAYIANDLFAEGTAKSLMFEMHETILSLNKMPCRFSLSLDPTLAAKGYRREVVKKYVILYLVDEPNRIVTVARVFHGSMNYSRFL